MTETSAAPTSAPSASGTASAVPLAGGLPRWIAVWFLISCVIQIYDALFVLTKPLSDAGNTLGWFWPGHHLYAEYDHRYAAFDAFGSAQSWLNIVEAAVLIIALVYRRRWSGVVIGLIVSVATFWKTVLYFGVEICSNLEYTRHVLDSGDAKGFLAIVIAPNAVWIIVPAIVIVVLGRRVWRVGAALGADPTSGRAPH
ncbi:MAG: hypothetical protein ABWX76_05125 [Leifsonia flava]